MMHDADRSHGPPPPCQAGLADAIAACERAPGPDRALDSLIALAAFPALAGLPMLGEGVWRHEDGSRVRALLYSATHAAAATLVPPGCWIESGGPDATVAGAAGEWTGAHPVAAIALCIAALRARAATD